MIIKKHSSYFAILAALALAAPAAHAGQNFSPSRIKSMANNGCLDIDYGSNVNGGHNVIVWHRCHGNSNQKWSSDGQTLRSGALCLQSYGNNVIAKKCDGGNDQKWSLQYNQTIISSSGKCLDVVAKANNGAQNVMPYTCHKGSNQSWDVPGYSRPDILYDAAPNHDVILPNYTSSQAVRIDCLVSGADDEETSNRITVSWYTSDGKLIAAKYRNGIRTCHGANDQWKLGESEEADYIIVSTNGSDGYLMDQIELYRAGKRVRVHGRNDSRGWCLSTDNTDHNKGNFNGHSVDSKCPSKRRFDY